MGSPGSAVIANLAMEDIEQRALASSPVTPLFWKRYVDDVISAVSKNEVENLLNHLNTVEPSFQFTVERENDGQLSFLDLNIYRKDQGLLETGVYRKPTHTDKYLAFDSHHPICHKKSVTNSENDNSMMGFACVPYLHGVTEPIKRILGSYNIEVAQKPFLTLNHIFSKPKDPVRKEQKSDAIYSFPCNDYNQEYIGQIKRQFGTRLKEHQKAVALSREDNSALSEHTCQTNHTISWNNFKFITTNQRYHQIRFLEALHINSAHAPLNRDDGGLLPDAYLHLINR